MPEVLERTLSAEERLRKARALVEKGAQDYRIAEEADAELSIRQKSAVACETAFHGLIELVDVLIERAEHSLPENHAHDLAGSVHVDERGSSHHSSPG